MSQVLIPWNSAEYLRNETDIADYLEAALQEGGAEPAYMLHVLNTIARARNMIQSNG
jgi:probable addiction module antidote protein